MASYSLCKAGQKLDRNQVRWSWIRERWQRGSQGEEGLTSNQEGLLFPSLTWNPVDVKVYRNQKLSPARWTQPDTLWYSTKQRHCSLLSFQKHRAQKSSSKTVGQYRLKNSSFWFEIRSDLCTWSYYCNQFSGRSCVPSMFSTKDSIISGCHDSSNRGFHKHCNL